MKLNIVLPSPEGFNMIASTESWLRWEDKSCPWVRIQSKTRGFWGKRCHCHLSILRGTTDKTEYLNRLTIKVLGAPDPNYRDGTIVRAFDKGHFVCGGGEDVFLAAFPISPSDGSGVYRWLTYRVKPLPERRLYLVRGVSGSGKSTLARELAGPNAIAADDFPGLYTGGYQKELQSQAHQWCVESVREMMVKGLSPIAIHNTFVRVTWMQPYLDLAKQFRYRVTIVRTEGHYQNIHDVPPEVLAIQRQDFEDF